MEKTGEFNYKLSSPAFLPIKFSQMNFIRLILACFSALVVVASCNPKSGSVYSSTSDDESPLNVILLIGDGMGVAQLSTSFYFGEKPSNFARFKCIGLQQTSPAGEEHITDSAASATAMSCGVKTYNSAIAVRVVNGDTLSEETVLEICSNNGKSTGLVATSSITHATPASFYAHVANRYMSELIAQQFAESKVDFAAAGGYQYFSHRSDGRNYLDTLITNGVVVDTVGISKRELSIQNRYAFLVEPDSLPSIKSGRENFLPNATKLALQYLSQNEKGFFLLVEGSQIDWGGHQNDAQRIIDEVIDFDKAIGVALDFAEKEGNTLVIVTGDHETGGFALSAPIIYGGPDYKIIFPTFSTKQHTACLIPVFASGPGAEEFMGIYQNSDIFHKMVRCMNRLNQRR